MITIGVDPGLSCGLALLHDGYRLAVHQTTPARALAELNIAITVARSNGEPVEIGIERFTITANTGRKSQQTDALEITGAVDLIANKEGIPVYRQIIADVKHMFKNPLLRDLGCYTKPAEIGAADANDANDAMRHALYCFATHHPAQYQVMIKRLRG